MVVFLFPKFFITTAIASTSYEQLLLIKNAQWFHGDIDTWLDKTIPQNMLFKLFLYERHHWHWYGSGSILLSAANRNTTITIRKTRYDICIKLINKFMLEWKKEDLLSLYNNNNNDIVQLLYFISQCDFMYCLIIILYKNNTDRKVWLIVCYIHILPLKKMYQSK